MGATDKSIEIMLAAGGHQIGRAGKQYAVRDLDGNLIASGDGPLSFNLTKGQTVVLSRPDR